MTPNQPGTADPAPLDLDGLRNRVISRLKARGNYSTWVLLATLAGLFTSTFPITILVVSLGAIAREFGAGETTVAWVIAGPMLLSAVALPLLGKLGDLLGHRRVFLAGYAAATVTAGLTALSWDLYSLIGFLTLSAVLGGATGPTSMALIMSVYPSNRRARAMGWWAMTVSAAPALGLIAGGPLVDWLGWRIVFVLQAGFSFVTLLFAAVVLSETPRQRVRFDIAGALALAMAVGGFMFALGRGREIGLLEPTIGVSCLIGVLGLVFFVRVERVTDAPLLPLDFFRRRNFTAPILSSSFMNAAYMGAFVLAPLVLIDLFGYSISAAAGIMLLRTLSLTITSPVGGWLGEHIGERRSAVLGAAVMTVALVVIVGGSLNESLVTFGIGLALQGSGLGLAMPSLTSAISNSVPDKDLGIASAANRLTGQIGAAVGITLLTMVYGGVNTGGGLGRGFAVGALLSALALVAAAFMRPTEGQPSGSGADDRGGDQRQDADTATGGSAGWQWQGQDQP
jgi:EmrB/QacA subfamily drug resistance transporter